MICLVDVIFFDNEENNFFVCYDSYFASKYLCWSSHCEILNVVNLNLLGTWGTLYSFEI